jgi:hypothetical protein
VKPCPLNDGMISIAIFDRAGAMLEAVSIDYSGAAVAAGAIENVAASCEKYDKKQLVDIGTDWQQVNEFARGVV